jgi:hypothetical protein
MTSSLPSPPEILRTVRTYVVDLIERVVATFVATVAGVAVAAGPADLFTLSFWEGAATAGLASAVSLVKGVAAKFIGDRHSASAAPNV